MFDRQQRGFRLFFKLHDHVSITILVTPHRDSMHLELFKILELSYKAIDKRSLVYHSKT